MSCILLVLCVVHRFEAEPPGSTAPNATLRTLSMIRIWNFNKSRIHSARGVRGVTIRLDDTVIYDGEIGQAPGNIHQAPKHAEVILFTTDPIIQHKLDRYTREQMKQLWGRASGGRGSGGAGGMPLAAALAGAMANAGLSGASSTSASSSTMVPPPPTHARALSLGDEQIPERRQDRPPTANANDPSSEGGSGSGSSGSGAAGAASNFLTVSPAHSMLWGGSSSVPNLTMARPHTSAITTPSSALAAGMGEGAGSAAGSRHSSISEPRDANSAGVLGVMDDDVSAPSSSRGPGAAEPWTIPPPPQYVTGTVITIYILKTWGDPHFVGLTGLELLGCGPGTVPIALAAATAPASAAAAASTSAAAAAGATASAASTTASVAGSASVPTTAAGSGASAASPVRLSLIDDSEERIVPLTASQLSAYPQDLNSVPGHSGDNRTLDKYV
jgi:hypothetical protein